MIPYKCGFVYMGRSSFYKFSTNNFKFMSVVHMPKGTVITFSFNPSYFWSQMPVVFISRFFHCSSLGSPSRRSSQIVRYFLCNFCVEALTRALFKGKLWLPYLDDKWKWWSMRKNPVNIFSDNKFSNKKFSTFM